MNNKKANYVLKKISPLINSIAFDLDISKGRLKKNILLGTDDKEKTYQLIANYFEVYGTKETTIAEIDGFIEKLNKAYQNNSEYRHSSKLKFDIGRIYNSHLDQEVYCLGLYGKTN